MLQWRSPEVRYSEPLGSLRLPHPRASYRRRTMPFISLDQLPAARVQWLWPGRLPLEQLSILDGDPGIGKSLLTIDLAARVTTGRPFSDGTGGGAPASVILLNAE